MADRTKDLAKIHLAKKQLGMDDDSYRDMLWTCARVRSAKDLDDKGRAKVLEHLRSRGWRPRASRTRRPHNYDRLPEYVTKVEALLADMGLPWSYADTIARNITGGKGNPDLNRDPGVDKLAWVKSDQHWRDIIAALSVEQEKRSKHATILELLLQLGKNEDYIDQLLRDSGVRVERWQRNRKLMDQLIDHLSKLTDHQPC